MNDGRAFILPQINVDVGFDDRWGFYTQFRLKSVWETRKRSSRSVCYWKIQIDFQKMATRFLQQTTVYLSVLLFSLKPSLAHRALNSISVSPAADYSYLFERGKKKLCIKLIGHFRCSSGGNVMLQVLHTMWSLVFCAVHLLHTIHVPIMPYHYLKARQHGDSGD